MSSAWFWECLTKEGLVSENIDHLDLECGGQKVPFGPGG